MADNHIPSANTGDRDQGAAGNNPRASKVKPAQSTHPSGPAASQTDIPFVAPTVEGLSNFPNRPQIVWSNVDMAGEAARFERENNQADQEGFQGRSNPKALASGSSEVTLKKLAGRNDWVTPRSDAEWQALYARIAARTEGPGARFQKAIVKMTQNIISNEEARVRGLAFYDSDAEVDEKFVKEDDDDVGRRRDEKEYMEGDEDDYEWVTDEESDKESDEESDEEQEVVDDDMNID